MTNYSTIFLRHYNNSSSRTVAIKVGRMAIQAKLGKGGGGWRGRFITELELLLNVGTHSTLYVMVWLNFVLHSFAFGRCHHE